MSLTLHRSSRGLDPATLESGRDLVLEVALEHGVALGDGVAVEDYLPLGERGAVDAAAVQALARWRERRADDLVVEGLDLGHVAEVELLATCFLPAEMLRRALAAIDHRGPVRAVGFDALALAAVGGLAPPGVTVEGEAAAPPPPPGRGGTRNLLVDAAERAWVPPWVRGQVVCVPYWHLTGVYAHMSRRRAGPRPVPLGLGIAGLSKGDTARALARGGWGGSSGRRARERSARQVRARTTELARDAAGHAGDPAMDAWALAVLARDAGQAPAQLAHFERVVRSTDLIVTPFDSPAEQRVLLAAGQRHGVASLVVQHGFRALLNDPDLTMADHVAVWSDPDRDEVAPRARGAVTVTGNPGGRVAEGPTRARAARGRTVILVEYASRLSAQVGGRLGMQHVAGALEALAAARPGTDAVIRPHPFDQRKHLYERAMAGRAGGLTLSVDATTPIEDLLGSADLCVGALSTATLQAQALGVPTVFLDLGGIPRPWPFDGTLPRAGDPGSLAAMIEGPPLPDARGIATRALGLDDGGREAVLHLIDSIVAR